MIVRFFVVVLPALCAAIAVSAAETPLRLQLPVACQPGVDCFIQNYVDTTPGKGATDFTCGSLSYDGHRGTDFAVATFDEMRRGVAVVAAADGQVRAIRDEMADTGLHGTDPERLTKRECGNGVLLTHHGGWTTQYCHMKLNSVRVKPGQKVRAGEQLGEIGYSGKTEFPHLHLTVRKGRKVFDPYTFQAMDAGCGKKPAKGTLWAEDVLAQLRYRPSGLIGAGFAPRQPKKAEVNEGQFRATEIDRGTQILAFWIQTFGIRKDDVEIMRVFGPRGRMVIDHRTEPSQRNRARQFRYVAKRLRGSAWPAGTYRGEYRLLRRINGAAKEILSEERSVALR